MVCLLVAFLCAGSRIEVTVALVAAKTSEAGYMSTDYHKMQSAECTGSRHTIKKLKYEKRCEIGLPLNSVSSI